MFFYKASHGNIDIDISNFVFFVNNSQTRSSQLRTLKTPHYWTRTFQSCYFNHIHKLWNKTIDVVLQKNFSSLLLFKRTIEDFRHNKCYSGFVKWMKSPNKDYIHDPTFRHSGLVSSSGVVWCWNSRPYMLSRWRHLPTRCKYSCGKWLPSSLFKAQGLALICQASKQSLWP